MRTAKPSQITMTVVSDDVDEVVDRLVMMSAWDYECMAYDRMLRDMRAESAERERKRARRSRLRRYFAESCALVVVLSGALVVVFAGWWAVVKMFQLIF